MIKWEWLTFEALIVGLGLWQLVSLAREKKRDEKKLPRSNANDK